MRVVILGGGFAGLTAANALEDLAAQRRAQVTLIEGSTRFQMGLAAQWVFAGRRPADEGSRPYSALRARHVQVVSEEAVHIDLAKRTVKTASAAHYYDRLILATGASYDGDAVPGLPSFAHNLCKVEDAQAMRRDLETHRGGTAMVLVARTPFKCPPAPYEYALLTDDALRGLGVRDRWKVVIVTPEPQPMPTAGKAGLDFFKPLLEARNIECHFGVTPERVEAGRVIAQGGRAYEFTVLGAMFPHRAPKVVLDCGLADASGFVPAELGTFVTKDPHVFAVGDVAALKLPENRPHPKAGAFAEIQALTVADAIRQAITGSGASAYSGRATCFIDTGSAGASAAQMHLLEEDGPKFIASAPTAKGLDEKLAFERERLARWFR
jgi:sulfide:quinone oxidoreductase